MGEMLLDDQLLYSEKLKGHKLHPSNNEKSWLWTTSVGKNLTTKKIGHHWWGSFYADLSDFSWGEPIEEKSKQEEEENH